MASDEAERLAAIIDDLADEEHNHVVSPPPGTLSPEVIALCRKNEADFRAIAALLRTPAPPPAPEGWRVRDALVNLLDVLSLGPIGCAAKYGPDVDVREVEAAAFYQARLALDASPAPPAHAELARRLRERAASLEDSDGMASDTSTLLREAANALEAP